MFFIVTGLLPNMWCSWLIAGHCIRNTAALDVLDTVLTEAKGPWLRSAALNELTVVFTAGTPRSL